MLPGRTESQFRSAWPRRFSRKDQRRFADIAAGEFKEVMKKATGLDGELISKLRLSRSRNNSTRSNWILASSMLMSLPGCRKKISALQPLLIARQTSHCTRLRRCSCERSGKTFADLLGKKLDMPVGAADHCRVFLGKICADKGQRPCDVFAVINKSAAPTDARRGGATTRATTVVDMISLNIYKDVRPGFCEVSARAARIRGISAGGHRLQARLARGAASNSAMGCSKPIRSRPGAK